MAINNNRVFILFSLMAIVFLGFCPSSESAFDLTASPLRGGSSLRFGRVTSAQTANQEVRLRINTNQGVQYQVFQSMIEPLISEKGEPLRASALKTYSITGSNALGTLYLQQMSSMKNIDDLVYTSNGTGQSDSFTMVYAIDPAQIDVSGRFSGKILYTLRPVSGGSQIQAYLDVFLEIPQDFKVQTQASSGLDTVRLHTRGAAGLEGYFNISFSGNLGDSLVIYQDIDRLPANDRNEEIRKDMLKFSVSTTQEGATKYPGPTNISKRLMIYTSKDTSDTVNVRFSLDQDVIAEQKAGVYRGQVKYSLEKQGIAQILLLDLEITIDPVFQLDVSFPEGREPRFDDVLPNSPPQVKEAIIDVKTNLGRPYMVVQKIAAPLANIKGVVFKQEFFDMKVEGVSGQGKSSFEDFMAVPQEERAIFQSDAKGTPCKIRVLYRLKPYPEMEPGNYLTSIVYSLGEI